MDVGTNKHTGRLTAGRTYRQKTGQMNTNRALQND